MTPPRIVIPLALRRRTRNDPSADTAACDVDGSLEEVLGPSGRGAAMPMASGSCRVRHDLQTTQAQVIAKLQVEVERLQDMLEDAEVREVEIEEQTRREVQQPLIADIDQLEVCNVHTVKATRGRNKEDDAQETLKIHVGDPVFCLSVLSFRRLKIGLGTKIMLLFICYRRERSRRRFVAPSALRSVMLVTGAISWSS